MSTLTLASVVRRSGPATQRNVCGSTLTLQRFREFLVTPSKYRYRPEADHKNFAKKPPDSISCASTSEANAQLRAVHPVNRAEQSPTPELPCSPHTELRWPSGCQAAHLKLNGRNPRRNSV